MKPTAGQAKGSRRLLKLEKGKGEQRRPSRWRRDRSSTTTFFWRHDDHLLIVDDVTMAEADLIKSQAALALVLVLMLALVVVPTGTGVERKRECVWREEKSVSRRAR